MLIIIFSFDSIGNIIKNYFPCFIVFEDEIDNFSFFFFFCFSAYMDRPFAAFPDGDIGLEIKVLNTS